MNERVFKLIHNSAVCSLVLGIITLVTGVSVGVLLLINSAKLLKGKSSVMI